MVSLDVHPQIVPPNTGNLAARIGAVEAEEDESLLHGILGLKANVELVVAVRGILGLELAEHFGGRSRKDQTFDRGLV